MEFHIRLYRESDAEALAHLYFDSVRNGTTEYYSTKQREAWAPNVPDVVSWAARLGPVTTFLAEKSDEIVGYMTLDDTGYIDLAFVRPDCTGQGIGSILYECIHSEAVRQDITLLNAQASEMAKPFFEKHGWILVKTQNIARENTVLVNHLMEKCIV